MIRRMDTNLELTVASHGSTDVLTLKGPLLMANLFDFQAAVRSSKAASLVVDMRGVPYIDSAGIGVLVGAYVNRDKDGRKLLLVGVNKRIHQSLVVTQVESFFSFADKLPAEAAGA